MRKLLLLLLVLLLSVWLGLQIAADPGYALFTYRGWSIEMPLWLAFAADLILFFILYSLIRLIIGIRRLSR
ncbi:MAG: hemY [Gammaproteobacteria bacterium]|jgi:HemY protein|nr:hemY [Gammaproteobacteria bacterium]